MFVFPRAGIWTSRCPPWGSHSLATFRPSRSKASADVGWNSHPYWMVDDHLCPLCWTTLRFPCCHLSGKGLHRDWSWVVHLLCVCKFYQEGTNAPSTRPTSREYHSQGAHRGQQTTRERAAYTQAKSRSTHRE